ncbi:MAG: hypothetical protein NTZ73_03305 [Candidatus Diapherotrites archaeon]|nr:hypothetical protein [Candidatus Diapherotrites archaeon]
MVSKKKRARRSFRRAPAKSKETVRVKTFIVEKPVYIKSKGMIGDDDDPPGKYDSKWSRYFRKRMPPFARAPKGRGGENFAEEDDIGSDEAEGSPEGSTEEYPEDGAGEPGNNEMAEDEGGVEDFAGEDIPEGDVEDALNPPSSRHKRSHGLFQNKWWLKGILKGVAVWLIILILAYMMDFLKMVNVEGWKSWFGFLIFLIIVFLVYEKFLKGKANI